MYMPHLHNHEEWETYRAKYNAYWKDKKQTKEKRKAEDNAADPPKKSASSNLSLEKSFKYLLVNQVNCPTKKLISLWMTF